MDRRGFLKGLAAVVGGIGIEQAIPNGRVWSFPKEIKIASEFPVFSEFPIGSVINIKKPPRLSDCLKFHPHAFAFCQGPLFSPNADIAEAYKRGVLAQPAGIWIDSEENISHSI